MKRWSGLLLFALVTVGAAADEKHFQVDPVHSTVIFRIRHLYAPFVGRFNDFSGTLDVDPADLSTLRIKGEVNILSIDTANDARNKHLLTPDFFDGASFPKARFESTGATVISNGVATVAGQMTMHGKTQPVAFHAEWLGYGDAPKGEHRAGLVLTCRINRQDFGIAFAGVLPSGMKLLGDDVDLSLALDAVELVPMPGAAEGAAAAPKK